MDFENHSEEIQNTYFLIFTDRSMIQIKADRYHTDKNGDYYFYDTVTEDERAFLKNEMVKAVIKTNMPSEMIPNG